MFGIESRYWVAGSEECYKSYATFEETLSLLNELVDIEKEKGINLTDDILVIQTNDGVFIRAKDGNWCTLLTTLVESPIDGLPRLEIITLTEWNDATTQCKYPINSIGDNKLARWRVGF